MHCCGLRRQRRTYHLRRSTINSKGSVRTRAHQSLWKVRREACLGTWLSVLSVVSGRRTGTGSAFDRLRLLVSVALRTRVASGAYRCSGSPRRIAEELGRTLNVYSSLIGNPCILITHHLRRSGFASPAFAGTGPTRMTFRLPASAGTGPGRRRLGLNGSDSSCLQHSVDGVNRIRSTHVFVALSQLPPESFPA